MKYGTSMRGRHLVGRLERGEELIAAITKLCQREKVKAAFFTAIGTLSEVELKTFDPDSREYVSLMRADEPLEVLSLTGNVSTVGPELIVQTSAMLASSHFGQIQIVGGHIGSARVYALEFTLQVFDDLTLERTFDVQTGLPLWNRILPRDTYTRPENEVRVSGDGGQGGKAQYEEPEEDEADDEDEDDDAVAGVHIAESRSAPTIIRRGVSAPPSPPPEEDEEDEEEDEDEEDDAEEVDASSDDDDEKKPPPATKAAWEAAYQRVQAQEEERTRLQIPEGGSRVDIDPGDDFDDFDDLPAELKAGDTLEHPTLGSCKVVRVEDEEWAFIRIAKKRKVQKLALRVFDVEHEGRASDGSDIFRLTRARRR